MYAVHSVRAGVFFHELVGFDFEIVTVRNDFFAAHDDASVLVRQLRFAGEMNARSYKPMVVGVVDGFTTTLKTVADVVVARPWRLFVVVVDTITNTTTTNTSVSHCLFLNYVVSLRLQGCDRLGSGRDALKNVKTKVETTACAYTVYAPRFLDSSLPAKKLWAAEEKHKRTVKKVTAMNI